VPPPSPNAHVGDDGGQQLQCVEMHQCIGVMTAETPSFISISNYCRLWNNLIPGVIDYSRSHGSSPRNFPILAALMIMCAKNICLKCYRLRRRRPAQTKDPL
jgi:hypothetical protein